jgi:hypothetical protein
LPETHGTIHEHYRQHKNGSHFVWKELPDDLTPTAHGHNIRTFYAIRFHGTSGTSPF